MTPKARVAYELYRDLGSTRTLQRVADLQGRPPRRGASQILRWSAKYEWQRLTAEHDHKQLRKALGKREVMRERGMQRMVDEQEELIDRLLAIARDTRVLPVMDRQGMQVVAPDGKPLYKPLVKTSTQVETIKWILGVIGYVPVKRMEITDRTEESLDTAAAVTRSMTLQQLDALAEILDDDDPDE